MRRPACPAFLLRYQQPIADHLASSVWAAGTMTKTSARESSDQDASNSLAVRGSEHSAARRRTQRDTAPLALATQTHTATREQIDQDPSRPEVLGTQTHTDSRESSDSDPAHRGWAPIPRA